MKNHLTIAAIALLYLTASNAYAACSRDDVSYYLSEGFTQEQITAICTAPTDAEASSGPDTPEPAANTALVPPAGGANRNAESYLREVIDGHDVNIEEGYLYYTARICIPYGRYNDNKEPWTKEACELVRHKVALQGMSAKREWIRLSLTQPRQIYLEGQIERELVSPLDDYSSASRRQIIQNLQTEVRAIVPIKRNISPERVLESLNEIAT